MGWHEHEEAPRHPIPPHLLRDTYDAVCESHWRNSERLLHPRPGDRADCLTRRVAGLGLLKGELSKSLRTGQAPAVGDAEVKRAT